MLRKAAYAFDRRSNGRLIACDRRFGQQLCDCRVSAHPFAWARPVRSMTLRRNPRRMRSNLKVMEGADVSETSAHAGALTSPLLEEQLAVETARGAERASLLRRLLLMSDVVAALVAGVAGAVAGGLSVPQALIFATIVAITWPVLAFMG